MLFCLHKLSYTPALSRYAGAAAGQQWPADGAGAAPAEASHQLLLILCGLLDSRLAALAAGGAASAGGEGGGQQPGLPVEGGERSQQAQQAEWLAEVAINACLLLRRQDALLGEVFPRWQPTPWLGTFLQQLEPHILRDELPSLAPEVGATPRGAARVVGAVRSCYFSQVSWALRP